MKTSSFATYTGPGRISIARWAPRDTPAGFRVFAPLATPRWAMSIMDKPKFCRAYFGAVLSKLDPAETWAKLHDLAGGAEPVMLCWEKPPFTAENFCHRRMVAAWFRQELGEAVEELPIPPAV